MLRGLLYAVFACLFWGTSYVIPYFLPAFSPSEIILGRYLTFGLFSLILILRKKKDLLTELKELPRIKVIAALALLGYCLYDYLEILNIRVNGTAATMLIYGITLLLSPIFIQAISTKSLPDRSELLSVFWPLCGLVILQSGNNDLFFQGNWLFSWGIVILQGILWIYFTRKMASCTREAANPAHAAGNITMCIGAVCLALSMFGGTSYLCGKEGSLVDYLLTYSLNDWIIFTGISALSGIGSMWFATQLWCAASRHIPMQMLSHFLLADVAAGKIYEMIIDRSSFSFTHVIGICVMMGGAALMKKAATVIHEDEDLNLAEVNAVAASPEPGIMPAPLMDAPQIAAYEV